MSLESTSTSSSSKYYYHPNKKYSGWVLECVYPFNGNLQPLLGKEIVSDKSLVEEDKSENNTPALSKQTEKRKESSLVATSLERPLKRRVIPSTSYIQDRPSSLDSKTTTVVQQMTTTAAVTRVDTASHSISLSRGVKRPLPSSEPSEQTHRQTRAATSSQESSQKSRTLEKDIDSLIDLTSEQKAIHDLIIKDGRNTFFSGAAGTGKSVLLRAIIRELKSKYQENEIAITAPTGIAAINIGGVTIHRWAHVGFGDKDIQYYVDHINKNNEYLRNWHLTKVLIIDEISMIDGNLLDLVESIARLIRTSSKPFGGIQTIFCGDFYQLPPVKSSVLAFESRCWKNVVQEYGMLTTPFRQKDMRFVKMLNDLRIGKVTQETKRVFQSLERDLEIKNNIIPTELYSRKKHVQAANLQKLKQLAGPLHKFPSNDGGDANLLENCIAPRDLCLKIGAQVMLIKNLASNLVNGSLGIVSGFRNVKDAVYPIVKFANGIERIMFPERWDVSVAGKTVAVRRQIPLVLAWAISIHKAQGKTIEYVKVDLQEIFEAGQAYTALSRATSLDQLQVFHFDQTKIKTDKRVRKFYKMAKME